jgi:hypothetical protein
MFYLKCGFKLNSFYSFKLEVDCEKYRRTRHNLVFVYMERFVKISKDIA